MKQFLISITFTLLCNFLLAQVSKTVDVLTAGTINTLFTNEEKTTVTNLTVTGNIDARDVRYMRDEMIVLNELDISAVNILAYYGTDGTSEYFPDNLANEMPWFSFSKDYSGNTRLKSIKLPNSIQSIGRYAFQSNTELTTIVIPDLVSYIGTQAFYGVTKVTSVTIGPAVTQMDYGAFKGCAGLKTFRTLTSIPPVIDNTCFSKGDNSDAAKFEVIYVPIGTVNAYKAATGWSAFADVITEYAVTVKTQPPGAITLVTAVLNGKLDLIPNGPVSAYGFCWNTSGSPTITDNKVDNGATVSTGVFSNTISDLIKGTTYYVRAFAIDGERTAYGAEVSFTTPKAPQEITFAALLAKTFGDEPYDLSAVTSSDLQVNFSSSNPAVASVNLNTVTILKPGTVTITASQSGNEFYLPAADVERELIINKAPQEITFPTLADKIFGDAAFTMNATATSNLTISYASSDPTVASIFGNTVFILNAGITTITASQEGDDYYLPASTVQHDLGISKASQQIAFIPIDDKTVGDATFVLTAISNSSLPVSFTSDSDKIIIDGNQATIVKAGRVSVTATLAGNSNYEDASVVQSFCIKPAKPTISTSDPNIVSATLASSSIDGNQWYLNEAMITGATNQTLLVTQSGSYKVLVNADDCVSEFSSTHIFLITGDIHPINSSIELYPSPVTDWLTISFGEHESRKEVLIYQLTGQQMVLKEVLEKEVHFNVANFTKGIYIAKVISNGVIKTIKFEKR